MAKAWGEVPSSRRTYPDEVVTERAVAKAHDEVPSADVDSCARLRRMRLDHVVIWAEDPIRTVEFFEQTLGFAPVRLEEFKAKKVMFPSMRVNDETIIDVMPRAMAPMLNGFAANSAGNLVNHVCIAMSKDEYDAVAARVERIGPLMQGSFGARGNAPHAFYFRDPDGNIFEARYY